MSAESVEPLVDRYIEDGQYFKALRLLRRMPRDIDALLDIAEILSDEDYVQQSDRALFEVLSIDENNEYARELLGQNSYLRGDIASAFYYGSDDALDMIADMHEDARAQADAVRLSKYRVVHPKDDEYVNEHKPVADEEFGKGNFEKAYKIYEQLAAIKPDDVDLLNDLGFVCLMLNRPKTGKKYIEKALELDENSVGAVSNAVLLYHMTGSAALKQKYAEKLDSFETDDPVKIFKIAASFCESGYHKSAKKWLKKHLEQRGSLEVMLLYAEACYNNRDFLEAKETLLDILAADPENATAAFYLDFVTDAENSADAGTLEYTPQLPTEVVDKKLDDLIERGDLADMWKDERLFKDAEWALYNVTDEDYFEKLADKIALTDREKAAKYFTSLLIRPAFDKNFKTILLRKALESGARGKIKLVSDRRFYRLNVPELKGALSKQLVEIISVLAFERVIVGEDLEKIMRAADETEQIPAAKQDGKAGEIPAAVIAKRAELDGMNDFALCVVFGVKPKDLARLYKEIYGD